MLHARPRLHTCGGFLFSFSCEHRGLHIRNAALGCSSFFGSNQSEKKPNESSFLSSQITSKQRALVREIRNLLKSACSSIPKHELCSNKTSFIPNGLSLLGKPSLLLPSLLPREWRSQPTETSTRLPAFLLFGGRGGNEIGNRRR